MRRTTVGTVAVAGALALAGCGGDGEEESGGDLQAFCDKMIEIDQAPDPFRFASEDDIAGAREALEESQALFPELVDLAPEEIRPDVEETARSFEEFAAEAAEASSPNDFLRIAARFQEENQDFVESAQRVGEFTGENCAEPEGAEG